MSDKNPAVDDQSTGQELSIEQRATVGLSQGTIVRRRFFQHRGAVISLFVLLFLVLMAFTSVGTVLGGSGDLVPDANSTRLIIDGFRIPGWWTSTWWERYDILLPGGAPTWTLWPFSFGDHPFGQDNTGKDVFARVMRGMQQSLNVVLIVGIISTVIGVVLGALAGYYRGWIDQLIMRLTDVIIIIPLLVLGAVLGRTIGGDAILLAAMLGLIAWTGMARLVRAEFLSLREREFVDAARVAGASDFRIIFRHILPNTVGVIVVSATLLMSAVILLETSLSFLGFGIKSPDISLGQIISEYNEAFKTRPWLFWWPGLFIVAIALCINFIGDGLRDAFDPRQKRVPKQGGAGADVVRFFKSYIPGARPGNENVNK
jgi:ABC-type dipeptide/oligopeptide/nickel transport system permease subunit